MIYLKQRKIYSKQFIINFLSTFIIPFIFISTIINMSGFGHAIGSNNITLVICMISLIIFCMINYKSGIKEEFLIFILMFFVFFMSSLIDGNKFYSVKIIVLISSIYVFSFIGKSKYAIKLVTYLYPIMTIYILNDFNMEGITKDWNTNVIGMIGFLGAISIGYNFFINEKKIFKLISVLLFINIAMLLQVTGARSAYLGILVTLFLNLILARFKDNPKKLKRINIIVYIIPVIMVIIIISLFNSDFSNQLNQIVFEYTEKPLFSGRESVWNWMFKNMNGFWLLGYGKEISGNAHNIFMNFLYSFGIIGYILYTLFFIKVINSMQVYIEDSIVRYSIAAYLSIYIQQSFECILMDGILVILVPYIFLMIGIGRCIYIKNELNKEIKYE